MTPPPTNIRPQRLLPFGLLIAGLVFLFNPTVNLIDPMPDAIGYALLILALRYTAEVFPHFDTAHRKFRILLLINLAKIPAAILMLRIATGNPTERTVITIFSLAFAIAEWIFLLPALHALSEGFTYLGEREGIRSAITLRKSERALDRLRLCTLIFFIVKGACTFLPEMLFVPTEYIDGGLTPRFFNPARLYVGVAFLAAIAVLAFGSACFVFVTIYLTGMKKDGAMARLLEAKAIAASPALSASADTRRKKLFFLLALAGFFFAIDLPLGNVDYLPDYVAALCFLAAFFLADKSRASFLGKIAASLYGVAAILRAVFAARFFALYKYTDVGGIFWSIGGDTPAALHRYIPFLASYVLEAAAFLAVLLLLIRCLCEFSLRYTGKGLRAQDTEIRNEVHAELFKGCRLLTVVSVLYSVLRPVSTHLLTITDRHTITPDEALNNEIYAEGQNVYTSAYAWLWLVVLAVGALLFVMALFLFRTIKEEANLTKDDE